MRIAIGLLLVVGIASCSRTNLTEKEGLKKYFDEYKVEGSFAMFDNSRGEHTIYNPQRDTMRFLPASTFKIVNALAALQTGRVTSDSTIIPWDSVVRSNPEWNKPLPMYEAFRQSSVPHFQWIARQIGRDTMQRYLDSIHYGNRKIGPHIDSFWLDNSLKISPDEQVGLVKMVYFRQFKFIRQTVQEQVKRMMIQENNTTYQLGYKTGWGKTEKGNELGWVVGWIEENRHVYFFALNLETPDHSINMLEVRKKILNNILTDLGFFKGKM